MKTIMLKLFVAVLLIGYPLTGFAANGNETMPVASRDTTICFSQAVHRYANEGKEPLYIVDDVITEPASVGKITLGSIATVRILDNKSPMTHYGKAGEYGIVLITTKQYAEEKAKMSQTPENRLIRLRDEMETAKTATQKEELLKKIGETGTFQAMMYASTYMDDASLKKTAAQVVTDIAITHPGYNGTNTRALLKQAQGILTDKTSKKTIKDYLKNISSKEKGYVSIFNGKDLTGWKGLVENPIKRSEMSAKELAEKQVKADETMRKDWTVENGSMIYIGNGYDNICTVKQYGNFEMYVDWKLDSNGDEPDAGIYLRGTPQVQIWDVTRVGVGAQVGSGGLYNNQKNRSTPLKVADNPLNEWNSFFIRMVDEKVTVYLNGILVVDNVPLENYWDRKQAIFPVEQLELQAHGSKTYFRNIYVKEL